MKHRHYCFTLNNWTEEEFEEIKEWKCEYIIVGEEVGENGTRHLQGYVEWANAKRLPTLKRLNDRIHWEERKGTAQQASEYCRKEGKIYEKGEISRQGARTDLAELTEFIKSGKTLQEIAEQFPVLYLKYSRGIHELIEACQKHRTDKPKVYWRWGLAGTGKTRFCVEQHPNHYIKDGTPWWNGYQQQEAIIIDDFDGKWPFRDFLRLLDRYQYQGQIKGGYAKINSPYIYITCEYPPEHFWKDNELAQVMRRLDNVVEVRNPDLLDDF